MSHSDPQVRALIRAYRAANACVVQLRNAGPHKARHLDDAHQLVLSLRRSVKAATGVDQ